MRRVLLLVFLFVLLRADEVDRIVREEMEKQHIPGISLAVLRDGQVLKMQGYGLANIELNVPATAESVYRIGSVSKQFIATGILMLQQSGKLSIDDMIGKHLEDAPASWSGVTLRHLLSHTSGIAREGPSFSPFRTQPDINIVRSVYAAPLAFAPGDKYQYSNVGYFALAEVITRLSGMPWPEFLRERIFVPLGMTATRTTTHDEVVLQRADGYIWKDEAFNNAAALLSVRPSGALLSSVIDLAKWDAALNTDQPLTTETRQLAWTRIRLNGGGTHGYGLGWNIGEVNGRRCVSHGGTISGFRSEFVRYLDDRLSIILLANAQQAQPGEIVRRVAQTQFASPAAQASR